MKSSTDESFEELRIAQSPFSVIRMTTLSISRGNEQVSSRNKFREESEGNPQP